ncbi:chromate transporter [Mycobacterium sp. KBS0706]|uniref:chromate transporter n=1 Tax=Mycobacterium sp. KBS0706 TaxID=2578109 RepID=UPI00110FB39A|nr:chromate transporter [Mycobacterium sp. KBS0706]TSD88150.1 chromate transporter [Mycobacterium sp. KBS0706]
MAETAAEAAAGPPGLGQIFLAFSKIGLTSFGGGLSGWMLREFVQNRRWVSEADFLNGLALAQAFPGVNVVNLSLWIGFRLRGGPGALAGVLGMIVPAMLVAIAAAAAFAEVAQYHSVHLALAGAAAAAVGLSLQMGVRAARRAARSAVPVAIIVVTFVAIGVLHLPLLPVMAVLAPLSIACAAWRPRKD